MCLVSLLTCARQSNYTFHFMADFQVHEKKKMSDLLKALILGMAGMIYFRFSRTKKGALSGLFDISMKLSTKIVLLVTLNFWYSASADLNCGDLHSQHFRLYIPEDINRHFEVNQSFHSKVMVFYKNSSNFISKLIFAERQVNFREFLGN